MKTPDLIESLKSNLKPVTPIPRPGVRFARWCLAALFCFGVGLLGLGVREDLAVRIRESGFVLNCLLMFLTALFSAASAFVLSVPGLEQNRIHRGLSLVTFLLWATLVVIHLHNQGSPSDTHWGFGCIRDLLIIAALPGALLFWMIRSAAPLKLDWTGGLVTLSVAALGALGTQLSCHNDEPLHLILWHILPVLVLGILGIFLGRVIFKGRRL